MIAGNSVPGIARIARVGWLLLIVATVSLYVIRQANDGPYGKDFTMFLTGAHMVADGQGPNLYDLGAQASAQEGIKGGVTYPGGVLPFNYPPYVAIFLSPLALLTPEAAYYAWLVVQLLILLALALSIVRQGKGGHALLLVMLVTFAPVIESLLMGQMSLVLVLLWWWVFLSWRDGNWLALGIAVALAAFKPQMVILLVVALLVRKEWRALAAAAATQAVLWGAAVLLFGISSLTSYIEVLRVSGTTTGTLGFYPNAMTNLRGLLTVLGLSSDLVLQLSLALWIFSVGAVAWIWSGFPARMGFLRARRGPWSLAGRFGLTALLAVIFSPHLYVHDASLLLIVPLCIFAGASGEGELHNMNWLLAPFTTLFIGVYLLVLRILPSYTPLILATLLCAAVMLYLLGKSSGNATPSEGQVDTKGALDPASAP